MRWVFLIVMGVIVTACAATLAQRQQNANMLAYNANMQKEKLIAPPFALTSYTRIENPELPIRIYIEGDGAAFKKGGRPSSDPTPAMPTALALAAQDAYGNVAYLARPCQYTQLSSDEKCPQRYWTKERYTPTILDAMNHAVDILVEKYHIREIELIGFSGGANIAALLAARRGDVLNLRTVAGNLDHRALRRHHNVRQYSSDVSAMDVAADIADIPQYHFIGAHDTVVPSFIYRNFISAAGSARCISVGTIDASHQKGWIEKWPELVLRPLACEAN